MVTPDRQGSFNSQLSSQMDVLRGLSEFVLNGPRRAAHAFGVALNLLPTSKPVVPQPVGVQVEQVASDAAHASTPHGPAMPAASPRLV